MIDSLKEAGTRHSADFQITPNGQFAVFTSILSLTGYANSAHAEVFRYDAGEEKLTCASCDPTNAEAAGDASLAQNGLSLSESGRVFFNSTDALVPHALNEAEDVYEWEPSGTGNCNSESPNYSKASGTCTALISTGISPFGSSLLSASANGTDVYFFTRDVLVPQDQNGELVKIYDARAQGGFPYIEPEPLCKASDECHGPGSVAPPPPRIHVNLGTAGNEVQTAPTGCKPGFVKKHGRCIRKLKPHHNTTSEPSTIAEAKSDPHPAHHLCRHRCGGCQPPACWPLAAFAAPALASEGIESFQTKSSTTAAGGHPDLTTTFELESPGVPESAQNVTFNAPQGVFGNPNAITECTSVDFANDQCPSSSQAGLITIRANYEANSNFLLGTAPIYDLEPGPNTALFAFVVPILDIPIESRSRSAPAPTMACASPSTTSPRSPRWPRAKLTFWGFPAEDSPRRPALPQRQAGRTGGLRWAHHHQLHRRTDPGGDHRPPAHRQPDHLHRGAAAHHPRSPDLPGPRRPSEGRIELPRNDRLLTSRPSTLSSSPAPRSTETDSASGLDHRAQHHPDRGLRRLPLGDQIGHRHPARRPDDQPRRRRRAERCAPTPQANFGTEGPAECPDTAKIGTFAIHSPALNGPLEGSVYIGQPEPGNQYRLFEIASGFGMNAKLLGSFTPNPETGQLTASFEDLPQVPFDEFEHPPLLRRTGPDGDPDRTAPSTRSPPSSTPGTNRCPKSSRPSSSGLKPAPMAPPARARSAPSPRALKPAPPTRSAAPFPPSRSN